MSNGVPPVQSKVESVSQDVRLLIAQTVRLARAESGDAARSAGMYLAAAIAGIGAAIVGVLVLVSALVLILIAIGLPPWAAALIIALLLLIGGGGTAYFCIVSAGHVDFDLPHTRRSIRESVAWLKAQLQ